MRQTPGAKAGWPVCEHPLASPIGLFAEGANPIRPGRHELFNVKRRANPFRSPALLVSIATTALYACTAVSGGSGAKVSPRQEAQGLIDRGEPAKALPLLEGLYRQAPEDLSVARALTEAHVKAGTSEALLRQLGARPESATVHYMRGLVYFSQPTRAGAPAIAELEQAVALAPTVAELHHRLGIALLESEHHEKALSELQRAVALAPDQAGFYLPLAQALHRTGDEKGATAALTQVISHEASPAEVLTARRVMDPIADPFRQFPRAARPRLEQGIGWLQNYDAPQEAILAFEEILHDFPDLAVVHALLGLAYQRLDDTSRAVEELKRAIELDPEDGKNHFYLGELYLGRQRPKEAEEHFRRAVELNPLLDGAYLHLGDLALERRELDRARDLFQLLVRLQPEATAPRAKLATALQLEGDFPGADRELKRASQLEPSNLELMLRLGLFHAERARAASQAEQRKAETDEAAQWLERVLREQPENALASRALEELRAQK